MTPMQEYKRDVAQLRMKAIRANMPEVTMIQAEFCNDFPNGDFTWSWSFFKIAKGAIVTKEWIAKNGLKVCRKYEATCLLLIGEKDEDNNWVNKVEKFWMKPL